MSELLDTYDDAGHPAGPMERSVVHSKGLWHRSVHVWLFDAAGRILVQRRPRAKDVCPECWDLSVGEHLQPGETYAQAAHRGLAEELGLAGMVLEPLGDVRRMRLDLPEAGVRDYELQQSFRTRHDGAVAADPEEVPEVRWLTADELRAALSARPEEFTPWCRKDLTDLAFL